MIYAIDLDNTLCTQEEDYIKAKPLKNRIKKCNALYDAGHYIIIYTARGSTTGIDWREVTEKQLKEWGVKYHELNFNKPYFDRLIDDKAFNAEKEEW